MRTLATQMRLRRLLRTQGEYAERLLRPGQTELPPAVSARLQQLVHDVRASWDHESGGMELATGLHGYVRRSLAAMDGAAAAMARPGADQGGLGAELRDAGLPLLFFLRGLDDSQDPVLAGLIGQPLRRSA
jgi:hypothetical protein